MIEKSYIYLDNNATTPVLPEVIDEMLPFFHTLYFNPGCPHQLCESVSVEIEKARLKIAAAIGGECSGEIIFTGSATEANNLALHLFKNRQIITSPIEHPSVRLPAIEIGKTAIPVKWVDLDSYGVVDVSSLERILSTRRPSIVSIQHANQVVHTIQPIAEISQVCKRYGALLHVDASQSFGRIALDSCEWGLDIVSISSHKCYGPKGIAALWIKNEVWGMDMSPLLYGGAQEKGLRPGTHNVPAIIGFGKACEIASKIVQPIMDFELQRKGKLLWSFLSGGNLGVLLNGHPESRLPGGIHCYIPGVDSKSLLASIPQIIASTGMACTHGSVDPVLEKIGFSNRSRGALRMQIGRNLDDSVIEEAARLILDAIVIQRARWGNI
jgi:cysteine desulfurase